MAGEELREWSDTAGRHKLTARLQAFSQDTVTLEMADGKLMEIQRGKLSTKDRDYVLTHHANLKKADDNPFKDKNAAKLEKLEAKLKESQRQIDENAQAASENSTKLGRLETTLERLETTLEASQRQVDLMAEQLIIVKIRAAAARVDALLLDQQFSKVEISCLEEQVPMAEKTFDIMDARCKAGTVTGLDVLEAKAGLCMAKGCLASVTGDLVQCQKGFDDAVAAWKERTEIVRVQYKVGTVDYVKLSAAEAAVKEAELCASRVKGRIAARESRRSK